jgi:uncharacterized protein YcbK (DUF882 family)
MPSLLHRTLLALALFFCMVAPAHAARAKAVAGPAKTETKPAKAPKAKSAKAKSGKGKAKAGDKAVKPRAEAVRRRIAKGTMTLRNLNTRDKLTGLRVLEVSKKGKKELARLSRKGKKKLAWMLRDFRNGKIRQPPDRLLYQLYQVQQHFDAPVEIVSGYRHWARPTSRHFKGWAVDFKVEGVDPKVVWAYCKEFKDVGCGHYPTSQFVHMDIRDKSYAWIDMSGPGERARYVNSVSQPEAKDSAPAAQEEE